MNPVSSFLKSISLFSVLEEPDLNRLASLFEQKFYKTGSLIITEGEESDSFFIIQNGTAKITRGTVLLTTLTRGEYFGEAALFYRVKRTANVEALDGVEVLTIKKAVFESFLDSNPLAAKVVLHEMLKQLFFRLQKTSAELEFERQGGFAEDAVHKLLT